MRHCIMAFMFSNIHFLAVLSMTNPMQGLSGNATFNRLENTVPYFTYSAGDLRSLSTVYMRQNESKLISCQIGSYAAEIFEWTLNGTSLSSLEKNRIVCKNNMKVMPNGTLYVENFVTECEGHYQCLATSQAGTVLAPFISLYLAIALPFSGQEDNLPLEIIHVVYTYQYLVLPCDDLEGGIPLSSPPYRVKWYQKNLTEYETEVHDTERIAIDPHGSIHFLWVLKMDNNWTYRCSGYNEVLQTEYKNTQSYIIKVRTEFHINWFDRPPTLVYNKDASAMLNTDARLFCIFSFVPVSGKQIKIAWEKDGFEITISQKYDLRAFGRQLVVKNVGIDTKNDSIDEIYKCKGTLPGTNTVEGRVKLTVVSQPMFTSGGELTDMEASVASNVEFTCKTYSFNSWNRPVIWLKNGEPINDHCRKGMVLCEKCLREQCVRPTCAYPNFTCADSSACLTQVEVCDGVINCKDASDEYICSGNPGKRFGRFTVSGDRTQLILNNVTEDDNMCFQCLVENPYGKLIGNGCLVIREHGRCHYRNGICVSCTAGYFGHQCDSQCNKNCEDGCDKLTGRCKTCKYGYFGTFCQQECPDYCKRLNETEHEMCGNKICNSTHSGEGNVCHRINGTCSSDSKILDDKYCNASDDSKSVTENIETTQKNVFTVVDDLSYASTYYTFGMTLAVTFTGLTFFIFIFAGIIYCGRRVVLHVSSAKTVYEVTGQNMKDETRLAFNRHNRVSGIYHAIRDSLVNETAPRKNTRDANVGTEYSRVCSSCRRAPTASTESHTIANIKGMETAEGNVGVPPIPI